MEIQVNIFTDKDIAPPPITVASWDPDSNVVPCNFCEVTDSIPKTWNKMRLVGVTTAPVKSSAEVYVFYRLCKETFTFMGEQLN